ncbi:MAG: tRNA (adenosine(37)-N6)-threonylcarbamoyltransferase complex dimerization subunit type 1 TsaB [Chloroflexota bacterium]
MAIDTATDQASLALHDGFAVRAEHTWEAPRRHTTELSPRIGEAMAQTGVSPRDLSGVAIAKGPGSFTGLRVGMSVAKGLAVACSLPLVAVPTLDVVAAAQRRDRRRLAAVVQAGRGRIAIGFYRWEADRWKAEEEPKLTTWADLDREIDEPTLFCGEVDRAGADVIADLGNQALLLPAAWRVRRAGFLAELGWDRLNSGEIDDPASLTPIYLKHPL